MDMSDFSSGAVIQTMTKVITTVLPKGIVVVLGVSSGEASDLALITQPLDRHLQDGYFKMQTYCEFLPFTNDDALKYYKISFDFRKDLQCLTTTTFTSLYICYSS